jgi:Predicted flavoprotein involved in K+ transport
MTVPDSQDTSNGQIPYTLFACIGTGFTGICLGATLRRWYGITSLALFTRDTELGGTWWQNRYPGAACDVPSALYSLSFAPNANWSRILPPADELCAYLKRVAEQYGLVEKTRFGTEVERAVWAEERARWKLTVREMKTGRRFEHECSVLISGAGQFGSPRELDIPGVKNFRGPVFHSARWRHDVSLEGKRVVVFGNGCTAAQIVPSIVGQVKHLTQIVRAKHWVYPPVDARIPEWGKAVLRTVPGLTRIMRTVVYYLAEEDWQGFANTKAGKKFREKKRKQVEKYMRETAPAKYHDLLIPDFEIGCKRRIFDSNYLASLHSENLTLTNEKPLEIVENGVKMESGKVIEADVIVLANGFNTNSALSDIEIVGRGGETLAQHWERFGGPEAYNCTSLSGFPNFFLILGASILYPMNVLD